MFKEENLLVDELTDTQKQQTSMGTAINSEDLNAWLLLNIQHMKDASIQAPVCWYDGSDGTCSA